MKIVYSEDARHRNKRFITHIFFHAYTLIIAVANNFIIRAISTYPGYQKVKLSHWVTM